MQKSNIKNSGEKNVIGGRETCLFFLVILEITLFRDIPLTEKIVNLKDNLGSGLKLKNLDKLIKKSSEDRDSKKITPRKNQLSYPNFRQAMITFLKPGINLGEMNCFG